MEFFVFKSVKIEDPMLSVSAHCHAILEKFSSIIGRLFIRILLLFWLGWTMPANACDEGVLTVIPSGSNVAVTWSGQFCGPQIGLKLQYQDLG
jgi:hypothetical protein